MSRASDTRVGRTQGWQNVICDDITKEQHAEEN